MEKLRSTEKSVLLSIPFLEAKEMVNNYIDTIGRDEYGQLNNTVSVWFSLDQLNQITDLLNAERDASAVQTPNTVTDGLRIYFANYGEAPPEGHANYADKNTVVLISTHSIEGRPEKHKDYFQNIEIEVRTEPLNRGGLCPPERGCDCSSDIFNEENLPLCEFP
ncbi:MAG: hypothetical protein EOO07_06375 [Chitinophagaceae bacterium]|nr:MAG: hypothetical protein EOO07_06375 [Chitinophagaceae bacterium]